MTAAIGGEIKDLADWLELDLTMPIESGWEDGYPATAAASRARSVSLNGTGCR